MPGRCIADSTKSGWQQRFLQLTGRNRIDMRWRHIQEHRDVGNPLLCSTYSVGRWVHRTRPISPL